MLMSSPSQSFLTVETVTLLFRPLTMLFTVDCDTPYEEQATKWAPYLRERYFTMLERCTYMTAVSLRKTPTAQLEAYRRIIDQSDMVLAVHDPVSARGDDADKAVEYARQQGRPLLLIHPDTMVSGAAFG